MKATTKFIISLLVFMLIGSYLNIQLVIASKLLPFPNKNNNNWPYTNRIMVNQHYENQHKHNVQNLNGMTRQKDMLSVVSPMVNETAAWSPINKTTPAFGDLISQKFQIIYLPALKEHTSYVSTPFVFQRLQLPTEKYAEILADLSYTGPHLFPAEPTPPQQPTLNNMNVMLTQTFQQVDKNPSTTTRTQTTGVTLRTLFTPTAPRYEYFETPFRPSTFLGYSRDSSIDRSYHLPKDEVLIMRPANLLSLF